MVLVNSKQHMTSCCATERRGEENLFDKWWIALPVPIPLMEQWLCPNSRISLGVKLVHHSTIPDEAVVDFAPAPQRERFELDVYIESF